MSENDEREGGEGGGYRPTELDFRFQLRFRRKLCVFQNVVGLDPPREPISDRDAPWPAISSRDDPPSPISARDRDPSLIQMDLLLT